MNNTFEVNESGTVKNWSLTHMALVKALKVLDALTSADYDAEQTASDLRDLNELRAELGMSADG